MAANVKVIPPKAMAADTLRVAAYCRVSSDSSDQLHSYAAQIRYYTDMIQSHDGWELVDVYADEGITGTRMDKREDLNRLLADCRKGKIDKVLVKSISRFARNTRDCLASLRELSRLGVCRLCGDVQQAEAECRDRPPAGAETAGGAQRRAPAGRSRHAGRQSGHRPGQ